MKFSLLSKNEAPKTACCEVIYDLSIDRAVNYLISDSRRKEYFLSVLSNPLTDLSDIVYRQQIFGDFVSLSGLFRELKTLFTRYDKIRQDWQELRMNSVPVTSASVEPSTLLEHICASLKVTAIFPGTIASYYESIHEILSRYDIKSDGLKAIKEHCGGMSENNSLNEIVNIAGLFKYGQPEDFDFDIAVTLDKTLRTVDCALSEIAPHRVTKKADGIMKLFVRQNGNENDGFTDLCEPLPISKDRKPNKKDEPALDEDTYGSSVFMQSEALSRLDFALTKITNDIYETFFGLSRELMFYESGLEYLDALKESGLPYCMPSVTEKENDSFEAVNLRDLYLICGDYEPQKLVPNDALIGNDKCGMLIKGMTDSGKTVYLRSVGTAQIFAQSGLPVFAEKAQMSIRNGFYSHFSSAEEEFEKGDIAGRFEGEAREVSGIIDRLTPYSLVFFNETFQTTSYREGTDGMAVILRFLPSLGVKYIFVTHLTRLFDEMKNENIILASTSDDANKKYKIIIAKKEVD